MNSKDSILSSIRANRPNAWPLPDVPIFETPASDKTQLFTQILERGGSKVSRVEDISQIIDVVATYFPQQKRTLSTLSYLEDTEKITSLEPDFYEGTDLAIVEGIIGVAENGALWITEKELGGIRVLPFITQHLVMIISEKSLVGTMHEAYKIIGSPTEDFGVFIAGPSKTADIEQSLVIGAQGARSLLVIITP
jgi:L-lactate dehydrogenase complex protein LldG